MTGSRLRARLDALAIRRGEWARVGLSFLYFFFLLSSYYALRPVREEMGVRVGVGRMNWLFTGTFVATLVATPVFGYVASHLSRRRLAPAVDLFFACNLVLFFFALRHGSLSGLAGPAFFVWLSVFNLFAVSVAWSLLTDLYAREEARRLFGVVSSGGTAGALAGPAAIALAAPRLGPEPLLLIAAAPLLVCALLAGVLRRRAAVPGGDHGEAPIGGGTFAGVARSVREPFLLAVALVLVCYTMVSTFLYFAQAEVVGAAIASSAERTALFARIDLAVNCLTIPLQLFVTAPLMRRTGIGGALALMSALVTAGIAALALSPGLTAVVAVQIGHRAGHFAVGRPAREALLVPLDAEARYKAKGFLDTAVFRGSDAASAWLLAAARSAGAGLAATAWLSVPIGIVWTVASWHLGGKGEQKASLSGSPIRPAPGRLA
ncbi:MAG: NTP/NDP exchange transporter [Thermoanaerobaculia bacterium]